MFSVIVDIVHVFSLLKYVAIVIAIFPQVIYKHQFYSCSSTEGILSTT